MSDQNQHQKEQPLQQLAAAEARKGFADMLAEAYYLKKKFLIEKCCKPMAVLLSLEEYETLRAQAQQSTLASPPGGTNKISKSHWPSSQKIQQNTTVVNKIQKEMGTAQ